MSHTKPYGCHNREIAAGYFAPQRRFFPDGSFDVISKFISHRMSRDCRYDLRTTDPRCESCKHAVADATLSGVSSTSQSTESQKCPTPS